MTASSITDIKKCAKCDNKIHARGLCNTHYRRLQSNNELGKRLYSGHLSIEERLELLSERITESGCQIWKYSLNKQGYGKIQINSKTHRAHRLAYETYIGEIPEGFSVCHTCDVRSCINPDHLFIGTTKDNAMDMVNKDRQAKGKKVASSKLSEEDIIKIRSDERSQRKIAVDYNVSQLTISNVKTNKWWKHVKCN
jgi:hypothetical protein